MDYRLLCIYSCEPLSKISEVWLLRYSLSCISLIITNALFHVHGGITGEDAECFVSSSWKNKPHKPDGMPVIPSKQRAPYLPSSVNHLTKRMLTDLLPASS